ncbi:MAG TPA: TolC family protein [Vicinamibacterales bacterium]|jgi:outer membrane protein TolC|nr:TolC family protein [Vicinamibacterales bacterium]
MVLVFACAAIATRLIAQSPAPTLRVTFDDAIKRAMEKNPTVQAAASAILRAEGLVRQARAATRLQITGNVTTTTLNTGVEFQGATVTPQNQVTASLTAEMPIVAAAAWARRAQAEDAKAVAELTVSDARRQIAFAAADAYLTILAQRRVVESNGRARDTAKAHFDLASELERQGTGSRLNALRAQQQWSTDEALVEAARLALYRAQEALGVLIAADEPADAIDEPAFAVPADEAQLFPKTPGLPMTPGPKGPGLRTDLKLFAGQQQAAEHVLRDSSKDWWPTVTALFQPSTTYPPQFFLPANSWRFLLQANVPIFGSGVQSALKTQREAAVDQARATVAGATLAANAQVRAAREAVASGERGLVSARAAADQAQQVLTITTVSFRAGAATNIEVIDASRSARDAETAVAIAEDLLRRARFELLNALGRFP